MFTFLITAAVPFLGHIDNNHLLCNAPCKVSVGSEVIFQSSGAVLIPFNAPPNVIIQAVI